MEDDHLIQSLVEETLNDGGFEPAITALGEEAVTLLAAKTMKRESCRYRFSEGHYDQLPALAADLVQRRVAGLVITGGTQILKVAQTASATIPIVFATA